MLPMVCPACVVGDGRLEDVMMMPCKALGKTINQPCSQNTVTSADNWDSVKAEICLSNIMQRDSIQFARKLNKNLVKMAKEKNKLVRRS